MVAARAGAIGGWLRWLFAARADGMKVAKATMTATRAGAHGMRTAARPGTTRSMASVASSMSLSNSAGGSGEVAVPQQFQLDSSAATFLSLGRKEVDRIGDFPCRQALGGSCRRPVRIFGAKDGKTVRAFVHVFSVQGNNPLILSEPTERSDLLSRVRERHRSSPARSWRDST